jgi:hypothetical protein
MWSAHPLDVLRTFLLQLLLSRTRPIRRLCTSSMPVGDIRRSRSVPTNGRGQGWAKGVTYTSVPIGNAVHALSRNSAVPEPDFAHGIAALPGG